MNLSIGQPHFDVPAPIKAAAKAAIDSQANGYSVTQGIPELRERLLADVRSRFPQLDHSERDVLVTSGTSGGLILALLATVNPGEEVITADPYFVAYPHMITLAGGRMVAMDAYPDFRIDPAKIEAAITPRHQGRDALFAVEPDRRGDLGRGPGRDRGHLSEAQPRADLR